MTGAEIRAFRQRAKLTQKALGAMIGVSDWVILSWEKGMRTPSPERIGQLEEVMKSGGKLPEKSPQNR